MKNLLSLRKKSHGGKRVGANMTFAHSTAGRTLSRTGMFLRKQLWVWPIIAVVLLSIVGMFVRQSIESTMQESLRSELQTLLDVETAMLETWFKSQESNAESMANDIEVRQHTYTLLEILHPSLVREASPTETEGTATDVEVVRQKLAKTLAPSLSAYGYSGFFLIDKNKHCLAASHIELLQRELTPEFERFMDTTLDHCPSVSTPRPSVVKLKDDAGTWRTGLPVMYACAAVRDSDFQVVAILGLLIRADHEFTRILQLGRLGKSGETYAFDHEAKFISNSRFDEELILLGLLPDQEGTRSILNLYVHDPGGDMTTGYRPEVRRSELPPTRMAIDALAGNHGVDVMGYRDYRGVSVVGAWRWLAPYHMGVATEIDHAEAYRPLMILRWTFWSLYALLAISSLAIFIFTVMVARLRREAQRAAIEAKQIGQYTLEQKLGAGGMGVVYKGYHAMLRRATAIKMLSMEKVNEGSLQRFEREVQITSQLNHPNTVAIYDYGRTPEGVFYYAMEYLDGIDLQTLVERFGAQSPERVIRILVQVCGSLYEAHAQGLVHRDIKPSNIMLNNRGGEPDVVKVLDFGLVKALDEEKKAGLTQQASLTGTPLYMSPEAIQMPASVDARSDIYAVGAVGYFLLTGQPVFQAENIMELCQQHIAATPPPLAQRTKQNVPEDLEGILLSCLEKSRAKRPQTARDLAVRLHRCTVAQRWSLEDAEQWWTRFARGERPATIEKPIVTVSHAHAATMDAS